MRKLFKINYENIWIPGRRGAGAQTCDCRRNGYSVRFPLGGMKYVIFSFQVVPLNKQYLENSVEIGE